MSTIVVSRPTLNRIVLFAASSLIPLDSRTADALNRKKYDKSKTDGLVSYRVILAWQAALVLAQIDGHLLNKEEPETTNQIKHCGTLLLSTVLPVPSKDKNATLEVLGNRDDFSKCTATFSAPNASCNNQICVS